ncbi:Uncharacterized protein Fot_56718 [Forsythia ovata]|uniref:Uncharacterized protein n=1 Tax=Forsythia ovata TaxID=205694 RepID=A0ABD1NYL1_9LAMI
MIEDDLSDVLEASHSSGLEAAAMGGHECGTIANFSRKNATPPQPAKKLVIKLNKGLVTFAGLISLGLVDLEVLSKSGPQERNHACTDIMQATISPPQFWKYRRSLSP